MSTSSRCWATGLFFIWFSTLSWLWPILWIVTKIISRNIFWSQFEMVPIDHFCPGFPPESLQRPHGGRHQQLKVERSHFLNIFIITTIFTTTITRIVGRCLIWKRQDTDLSSQSSTTLSRDATQGWNRLGLYYIRLNMWMTMMMTLIVNSQAKPSPEIYTLAASLFNPPPPSSACLVFEVGQFTQYSDHHQYHHHA